MNTFLLRYPSWLALGLVGAAMTVLPASAQVTEPKATAASASAPEPSAQVKPVAEAASSVPAAAVKPAMEPPPPATETAETTPTESYDDAFDAPPLQVGDATMNLLAWQSSGAIASQTPRRIPGDIARRNYERYLKSFEHPIPEYMGSSLNSSNGAASSGQAR
ncbi:DUF3613 domain-containing protein [Variovorax sp. CY25R-8]|uniref:DUF3613 domain-containing protein n=1 Tax=Variovorax sp. CY25R-8 TaxID=2855501 RepID=UPI0021BA7DE1|nr:DUF3613 domain-containing protein [Variovorax sp. CY25R-8]MCT8178325.1 DUF3613 domain-containing protein [Variovorax sp. CY25R-8]